MVQRPHEAWGTLLQEGQAGARLPPTGAGTQKVDYSLDILLLQASHLVASSSGIQLLS